MGELGIATVHSMSPVVFAWTMCNRAVCGTLGHGDGLVLRDGALMRRELLLALAAPSNPSMPTPSLLPQACMCMRRARCCTG